MDFKTYYLGLTKRERETYARRAGTTTGYIQSHLVSRNKIPRKPTIERLAAASQGACSVDDLLAYFYERGAA